MIDKINQIRDKIKHNNGESIIKFNGCEYTKIKHKKDFINFDQTTISEFNFNLLDFHFRMKNETSKEYRELLEEVDYSEEVFFVNEAPMQLTDIKLLKANFLEDEPININYEFDDETEEVDITFRFFKGNLIYIGKIKMENFCYDESEIDYYDFEESWDFYEYVYSTDVNIELNVYEKVGD